LFPFGSRLMIQNVKFTKIGNNCNIVIRESVLNERGNVIDVVVFRAKCVASVKQHVYSVVIAFIRCFLTPTSCHNDTSLMGVNVIFLKVLYGMRR
jgi:hypothetical protein